MQQTRPACSAAKSVVPDPGFVICGRCGRKMTFRKAPNNTNKKDYLVCHARECSNVSTSIAIVEERLITALRAWLENYKLSWTATKSRHESEVKTRILEEAVDEAKEDRKILDLQLAITHDLLEQGIYDSETFLSRSRTAADKIRRTEADIVSLTAEVERERTASETAHDFIPRFEKIKCLSL